MDAVEQQMPGEHVTGQPTGPQAPVTPWRVTYRPGTWTLLTGPSAVVVLEPAPARASAMVASIWELVLGASGPSDLVARLAGIGLDAMPRLAVVFRDDTGLHALLRGDLALTDGRGTELASGRGARTWRECDLTGPAVELALPGSGDGDDLDLPLLVGAARVARVHIDVTEGAVPEVSGPWTAEAPTATPDADHHPADAGLDAADAGVDEGVEEGVEGGHAVAPVLPQVPGSGGVGLAGAGLVGAGLVGGVVGGVVAGAASTVPVSTVPAGESVDAPRVPADEEQADEEQADAEQADAEQDDAEQDDAADAGSRAATEDDAVPNWGADDDRTTGQAPTDQTSHEPTGTSTQAPTQAPGESFGEAPTDELVAPWLRPSPTTDADEGTAEPVGVRFQAEGAEGTDGSDDLPVAHPAGYAAPEEDVYDQESDDQDFAEKVPSDHDGEDEYSTDEQADWRPPSMRDNPYALDDVRHAPVNPYGVQDDAANHEPSPYAAPESWTPVPVPGAAVATGAAAGQPAPGAVAASDPDSATVFQSEIAATHRHDEPAQEQDAGDAVELRTSDGQRIVVERSVVVGRAPSQERFEGADLLRVASPSHDISRNHVLVGHDAGVLVVTDLHSTNGTLLTRPGGVPEQLEPGHRVPLEPGAVIDLGDGLTIDVVAHVR